MRGLKASFSFGMPDEVEAAAGGGESRRFSVNIMILPNLVILSIRTSCMFRHRQIWFARKLGMDLGELEDILVEGTDRNSLKFAEERIKPGLDDKILTSWNGLMIRSMAMGYQVLGDERYREAAERGCEIHPI